MNDDINSTRAALPEPANENVAALEREARARREAELRDAPSGEDAQTPLRPAITRLKHRRRSRATVFFAMMAVALTGLAWGSNWIYRTLIRQPESARPLTAKDPRSATDARQRTDLGQNIAAAPPRDPPVRGSGTDSRPESPPDPDRLDKARFLLRRENGSGTQAVRQSRLDEMAGKTEAGTVKAGQPQTDAAEPQAIRRIPYDPDLYIPENTAIPCSLDYRFVSERAGKVRCTIASDIWSASGHTRLIEKGTTASGMYQSGQETGLQHGQARAFIIITRLRTRQPPYLDIPLVETRAAGALGEAGVEGWVDSHFWQRFGGAMMVGMIPDVAAWASNSAGQKDRNTDYTENSRQAMAEMARTTLENSINIPPTLYKNQGEIISLVTGQDIDFSAIYTLRMKHDR
jgi:type IV secretion system protein VirB10